MPETLTDIERPKARRRRPAHLLKPGSRAAFVRGCKCFTLTCFTADETEHQAHCPLRRADGEPNL